MIPTIGRTVVYTLSEGDADEVNRRRADAEANRTEIAKASTGYQVHVGNLVRAGDQFPLVIVRVWGQTEESQVNGKVLLDGTDELWVTSVGVGEGPRTFAWPSRR